MQAPASLRSAGIAALLPVAAAIGVSVPLDGGGAALAGWTVAGGALVVAVGQVAGLGAPPQPVTSAVAWRHAVVAAVAVGGATLLTTEREVGHGYWLVLTLAVVLRPVRDETVAGARDRAAGTILGIAAAVAVVLLLPPAAAVALAVACVVVANAWALVGNLRRQALFTTPAVVLMSSSGVASAALGLAAERLVLTLLGALLAAAAAVVLARWDGAAETAGAAGPAEGDGRAAVARLAARVAAGLSRRWPGRIALHTAASLRRVELFDRSMAIAAQFFTSVFPILIVAASWAGERASQRVAQELNAPAVAGAVAGSLSEPSSASFGILGSLIVLVSATSLSRTLTRSLAVVWQLPRPRSRIGSVWRWLSALTALALSLVATGRLRSLVDGLPPSEVWSVLAVAAADAGIALFVSWVLLEGKVRGRLLLPGALLYGAAMVAVRPASASYFSYLLSERGATYGSIGVAFIYLAWLYLVALCFLTALTVGQTIATDEGGLGRLIRGERR
ncbi:YhjD/YihY/BrkB family envelope integrity protein [Nocardioides humi]|uniref:Integral membrane bound transporter domain-containing protein n=1 Tax=Nocardioides humi TaxID=449461 RepID=A0ABN2A176_9ACTN|nr:YhjD/YihY/BrkB family envelope integrity protein [Nocardioides humi]